MSSSSANSLPYRPYQVKPPPNQAIIPPQISSVTSTAPAQPFFVPSPPRSVQSAPSQPGPWGPAAASPCKAAPQQPPVTLTTITPTSQVLLLSSAECPCLYSQHESNTLPLVPCHCFLLLFSSHRCTAHADLVQACTNGLSWLRMLSLQKL